jgi:16S rRNA C967 or C1407 C5-methylase (RsmB/RsmF family)/NOL1/NOP2/fmu family ribosome biogenesis protein
LTIPASLLQHLQEVPGFDEQAFIAAHQSPAPTSVRVHPLKDRLQHQGLPQVPWCKEGCYLPERPVFTVDPLFHAGAYYVQEASSMFLDAVMRQLFPDNSGLRVLDLCAAPGGKSTLLASWLAADSLLVSNEVIRPRASILEENMTRWGYMNTWVTSNDPRDFGRLSGYFDAAVVDAPCSGSGLFRKDPAALNEWSEANVQLCCERQQRIIADVWPALKENGFLVYSTCSYSPEENEQVLDLLADQLDMETVPVQLDEHWNIIATRSPRHGFYGYRFSPDRIQGEGFFLAVLQKKESAGYYYPKFRSANNKKAAEQASHFLQAAHYSFIENDRKMFTAILAQHEPDLHLLREVVYLRKAGTLLGMPAQKDWIPEHDIALSVDAASDLPRIELSREQSLLFLKKENIDLPEGTERGWHIVTHQGLGLGWIKVLGNRVNNYLPKHWRIRMNIDSEL